MSARRAVQPEPDGGGPFAGFDPDKRPSPSAGDPDESPDFHFEPPPGQDVEQLGPTFLDEEEGLEPETTEGPERPPLEAAPLDPKIWRTTIAQADRIISAILAGGVPSEPADVLDPIADGVYPLVRYYSQRAPSVASLWLVAGLSALAYGAVKYARVADKQRQAMMEAPEDGDEEES